MRHSRIGTTMDICAQFVPEFQRRAVARMMQQLKAAEAKSAAIN
jgi:hypothetical protein